MSAWKYSMVPPTSSGCRPRAPDLLHGLRSRRARTRRPNSSLAGSRISIRWCGMRARVCEIGLGGADVHAAVDLGGVHAHDLERKSLARDRARAPTCRRRSAPSAGARAPLRRPADLRLRSAASAPAHEQPIEIPERQPHPGRAAVIALVGAIGALHLAQQRVHLRDASDCAGRAPPRGRPWCRAAD